MLSAFRRYRHIEKSILLLIAAEFFIQLINASFMLILNIYMDKQGYPDYLIADFVSYRFAGVILFALPLGLYIRGKKLLPLFTVSGILSPSSAFAAIIGVSAKIDWLIYLSLSLWGIGFTCFQVSVLPFILRNGKAETRSEAISLSYSTWSLSNIIAGFFIFSASRAFPAVFSEHNMLLLFTLSGFASLYFIFKIGGKESVIHREDTETITAHTDSRFDWKLIVKALTPSLIIAVGAGLTIPFINLFFYKVHHLDSGTFSLIGSFSAVLVTFCAMAIPQIKRKYGYPIAITLSQSLAVAALALMASTEYYSNLSWAVYAAVLFYLLRQPLMNMAGPMTSELMMSYVGKKNQEIVSALIACIWSGSWFISSKIFMLMRLAEMRYGSIFLVTACIYVAGVCWYYYLIRDFNRRNSIPGEY